LSEKQGCDRLSANFAIDEPLLKGMAETVITAREKLTSN
jgi:hypothetical protein